MKRKEKRTYIQMELESKFGIKIKIRNSIKMFTRIYKKIMIILFLYKKDNKL